MIKKKLFFTLCIVLTGSMLVAQVVNVSTPSQLQSALTNALPGQVIIIADGVYNSSSGNFTVPAGVNGTSSQPITLRGSRNAVLTTADSAHGYGLWLTGNQYWILKGFTTRYCKNGIVIDGSQYITVDSVLAKKTGQEAIHLRTYTNYCMVKNCFIDSTGLLIPGEGEGIYIGSAVSNWCTYTQCNPDTCNYDSAFNNSFGAAVAAENIDIKEGTRGGVIKGNHFNGAGLSNQNGADSWIDMKGNNYTVENNDGINSVLDGFQTHIASPGCGNFNTFRLNIMAVNSSGYGIRIQTSNSNGTANGNILCNNNVVTGAASGTANVPTQTCGVVLAGELLYWSAQKQNEDILFAWNISDENLFHHFEIEQSADGRTFSTFKIIQVSGNTYISKIAGRETPGAYFRLALYKKTGNVIYSSIIYLPSSSGDIKIFRSANTLIIYNPSDEIATARLINPAGKMLFSATIKKGYNYLYPLLSHGVYFVELRKNNNGNQVARLVW